MAQNNEDKVQVSGKTWQELGLTDESVSNIVSRIAKDNPGKNPFDILERDIHQFLPEQQEIDIRTGKDEPLPELKQPAQTNDMVPESPLPEGDLPSDGADREPAAATPVSTFNFNEQLNNAVLVASNGGANQEANEVASILRDYGIDEEIKNQQASEKQAREEKLREKLPKESEAGPGLLEQAESVWDHVYANVKKGGKVALDKLGVEEFAKEIAENKELQGTIDEGMRLAGVAKEKVSNQFWEEVHQLKTNPVDYYINNAKTAGKNTQQFVARALDAVANTANFILDVSSAGENFVNYLGGTNIDVVTEKRIDLGDTFAPPPEGVAQSLWAGAGEYLTPFAAWAKALNVGKSMSMAEELGRVGVAEFLAGLTAIDPEEKRLSDLVQANPRFRNVISGYLSSNPDDNVWDSRLKNAIEGTMVGVGADFMFQVFRGLRIQKFVDRVNSGEITPKPVRAKNVSFESLDELHPSEFPKAVDQLERKLQKEAGLSSEEMKFAKKALFESVDGKVDDISYIPGEVRKSLSEKGLVTKNQKSLTKQGREFLKNYNDRVDGLLKKVPDVEVKKNNFEKQKIPGVIKPNTLDDGLDMVTRSGSGPDQLLKNAIKEIAGDVDVKGLDITGINYSRIESRADATSIADLIGKGIYGKDMARLSRRGVVPDDLRDQLAEMLVTSRSQLERSIGEPLNDTQQIGAAIMLKDSMARLRPLLSKARMTNNPADQLAAKEAIENAMHLGNLFEGSTAEVARSLRAIRDAQEILGGEGERHLIKEFLNLDMSADNMAKYIEGVDDLVNKQGARGLGLMRKNMQGGASLWDALFNANQAHLLTGIDTQIVNIVAGIPMQAFEIAARGAAATKKVPARVSNKLFGTGLPRDYVTFGEVAHQINGTFNGLRRGLRTAGEVLKTGRSSGEFGFSKVEQNWAGPKRIDLTNASLIDRGIHMLQSYAGVLVRPMIAGDELIKTIIKDSNVYALAHRRATFDKELTSDMRKQLIDHVLHTPSKQLLQEGWSKAYRKKLLTIEQEANFAAKRDTFTLPLEGKLKSANDLMSAPIVRYFFPFRTTSLNMVRKQMEMIPGLNKRLPEVSRALEKGGAEADLAMGRIGIGATIGATAYAMSLQGKLTGRGPQNSEIKKLWEKNGWTANTIQIGDTRIDYERILGPFSFLLSVPAGLMEIANAPDLEWSEKAISYAAIMGQVVTPELLMDFGDLMHAIDNRDGQAAVKTMEQMGARFTPGFVRDLRKYIDPLKRDNEPTKEMIEDYGGFLANSMTQAKNQIPWLSLNGSPTVDLFGEEEGYKWGLHETEWPVINFLMPFNTSSTKTDPVVEELLRLKLVKFGNGPIDPEENIGNRELHLSKPSRTMYINKVPIELEPQEYYELSKLSAGQSVEINGEMVDGRMVRFGKLRTLKEAIKAMMDSNYSYKNIMGRQMTDELKREEIRELVRGYHEHGRMLWQSLNQDLVERVSEGMIDIDRAKGGPGR